MKLLSAVVPAASIALAIGSMGIAHAETTDTAKIRDLEKKLERSMELIDQLSKKLDQIERTNTAPRAAAASPEQSAKIEQLEKSISEIGSSLSRRGDDSGLPVHGFADVGLAHSGENNATFKGRKGGTVGTFDLYLTPQFGSNVKSLVELNFEVDRDGGVGTDLERAQIGYTFSDSATGWMGRFHTPYGYWNTGFHHGAQIQTSINRPMFLDFEDKGGILPAHSTGLWLTGSMGGASGKFGYDAYVANAPQINGTASPSVLSGINPTDFNTNVNAGKYAGSGTLDMRMAGSTTNRNSVGFNAWFEPRSVDGLRLGAHGLRAEVVDDSADANRTRLNMLGGYLVYLSDPWEILGEYYGFRNQDLSGSTGTHSSWAAYGQVGYNIGKWTPFARAERTDLDQKDNYFAVQESGRSYKRFAVGVRYDVDPKAAIKVELDSTRKEDLGAGNNDTFTDARVQYSIRF
ncbi:MAG TPA: hypothetical protein VI279_12960 [Rhodocyclaceae bacterium]